MKLIIIRHAEPDYSIDSLTEKGWREAGLLAERMMSTDVTAIYMSPLGRAKDTASITLSEMKREATILTWLREFKAPIMNEKTGKRKVPWDWIPEDWTNIDEFYDKDLWHTNPVMKEARVFDEARTVYEGLDELLYNHGYKRHGKLYEVEKANSDTIVLFCHFGVECVMLGHLLGVSPMVLWHGLCAAPSSVTTLVTEERREGIASFRMSSFADISHLYVAKEEPAFAARFCETYDNMDQRH